MPHENPDITLLLFYLSTAFSIISVRLEKGFFAAFFCVSQALLSFFAWQLLRERLFLQQMNNTLNYFHSIITILTKKRR